MHMRMHGHNNSVFFFLLIGGRGLGGLLVFGNMKQWFWYLTREVVESKLTVK
jgi:hypothetical protein